MRNREDLEVACREAYENMFHKIPAAVPYDEWRRAFMAGWKANAGLQAGWAACCEAWADHMKGMAEALAGKGRRCGQ
jgi:hypothetical protein